MAALTGVPAGAIAVDSKTVRRSKDGGNAAIHMVSAFAARQRLVLGQVKVAEKSNEIIDKKTDYVLALKGNQSSLREDVELFVAEQKANGFKDTTISQDTTIDADHSRIETRTTTVIHDVGWLQKRHAWPDPKAVIMVESRHEISGKAETETRFYIASPMMPAHLLGPIVRSHRAIENSLHWVLDMVFHNDECRIRTEHAPANFTTIKHMAHNLLRTAPGKNSLRGKRKAAGRDDEFLASLITG